MEVTGNNRKGKKKSKKQLSQDEQDSPNEEEEEDDYDDDNKTTALNELDRKFIFIQVNLSLFFGIHFKRIFHFKFKNTWKMEYCGGRTLKYLIDNGLYKSVI